MREILFRGKRTNDEKWVEGSLLVFADGDSFICCSDFVPDCQYKYEIDPATVCQYTGLTDKNDAKIFEGDICKDSAGFVFEVQWDNEDARFLGRHDKLRGDTYICYVGRIPAVEVIGNIHDKPELLGKGEVT